MLCLPCGYRLNHLPEPRFAAAVWWLAGFVTIFVLVALSGTC